ncbi:MAG TPA: class I SAM-dependent methyltransferase [Gaiellaceae bacterium]|nr:class I SAM-dependent methyltransferase [Gaiellaceae bacterium]
MADDDRLRKRASFDQDAERYLRGRPRYPEFVIDDVVELTGFGPGSRIVEIGCGTGQATSALAERGIDITCVELGLRLAEVASRELARYTRVRVVHADVEHWQPDAAPYDGVAAFLAFQWLDPERRYDIAAALLRPDGALAVSSVHHVMPPDADPFYFEVQEDYRAVGMGGDEPPPPPEEIVYLAGEIEASPLFGPVTERRRVYEVVHTAAEHIALLDTYSPHLIQPDEQRQALFDLIRRRIEARPGGTVRKSMLSIVQVARRR